MRCAPVRIDHSKPVGFIENRKGMYRAQVSCHKVKADYIVVWEDLFRVRSAEAAKAALRLLGLTIYNVDDCFWTDAPGIRCYELY